MPGIAALTPNQLQIQPTANALDSQPDVNVSSLGALPEFKDFMDAYKQGVITADDIRKREIVGTTGFEAERAGNLAKKTQAEQANIDLSEVQPRRRELEQAQLTGGIQQQTLLNQMSDPDPNVALPAREAFSKRQHEVAAIQVFGTATPRLQVNANVDPPEFDNWVNDQVNAFSGTPTERAVYEERLRTKGEDGEEYKTAVKAAKSATIELNPGTTAYDLELRKRTDEALTHEQLQQIQFKTLEEFGKAKAAVLAKSADTKAESAKDLTKEYSALPALHDFDKVDAAHNKLLAATDPGAKATPLRDQAAIFSWMKILDPGSTVREGEYASVKNARGIPDKIMNWYNQTLTGQILTPEQRLELREAAEPVFQGQVQNLVPRIKQYVEKERLSGLAPGSVVPLEHRALLEPAATTPAASAPPGAATTPRPTPEQKASAPSFTSPSQVPNTVQFFYSPDGKLRVNPNFKP